MRIPRTLPILAALLLWTGGAHAQSATESTDSLAAPEAATTRQAQAAGEQEAQIFVSALQAISRLHQGAFTDSTLWANALDGLIESLEDPYASVFTPEEAEEFDEDNTGNYAGIGVQITELNDRVTVTAVFRSTPADRVGMQVGDIIVGVDGHDASEWGSDMVADSVRGPVGTDVEVRVQREGYDTPIAFPITRAQVHVPAVSADHLADDIVYVSMDRVARGAAQEMDSVLRLHGNASGLVVDLRRNPGGYLDESLMLADLFLEPGQRLASTRSRDPSGEREFYEESWDARMAPRLPETPVVILVDQYTASAAEILAGALQDYDRALILGQRTFGKGVVQTVLELPFGRRLRLTTGAWYTPLGRSLHRARDGSGRPVEEGSVDSLPTVLSEHGRELVAAGGIFPDLTIPYDTLTLRERDLLATAAEARIPLPLRIAEFGFAQAQILQADGLEPQLREEPFLDFVKTLEEEGLPPELLNDPEVRDYLAWSTRIAVAERMDRLGAAARVRMERDQMLSQAVALLRDHPSQSELFAAAQAMSDADETTGQPSDAGSAAEAGGRR